MLLLDHVGAKSGTKRTSPLLYIPIPEAGDVFIVASKGGYPKNPAWFYNLRAHPDTTARIGRERRAVHARVATDEERERLWPLALELYPTYATYQRRSKGRQIPLVMLERRDAQAV
jgi:deazaflavin-dependent oxidoreductase (nitroreductase family)